jgi:hypothetical protein
MASVLVGFLTIFIGVFMVNDSKASSSSFIERSSIHRSSIAYEMETGSKRPLSEFIPLKEADEDGNFHNM